MYINYSDFLLISTSGQNKLNAWDLLTFKGSYQFLEASFRKIIELIERLVS